MTKPFFSFYRIGGLYHWRAFGFGGSFYKAAKGGRKPPKALPPEAFCITAFSPLPAKARPPIGEAGEAFRRPIETVIDGLGIGMSIALTIGLLLMV